jgi:hypothetical protein
MLGVPLRSSRLAAGLVPSTRKGVVDRVANSQMWLPTIWLPCSSHLPKLLTGEQAYLPDCSWRNASGRLSTMPVRFRSERVLDSS